MRISRLRLALAARFALAFFLGLGAADCALFLDLRREAHRRFNRELAGGAAELALAVRHELADEPSGLPGAVAEALANVPPESAGFVVYNGAGARVGARGPDSLTSLVPALAALPPGERVWNIPLPHADAGSVRLALARSSAGPAFTVVALRPTTTLREATTGWAVWFGVSAPLVVVLALAAGYLLAGQVLRPLRSMTDAITAIGPGDLDRRLPVRHPPDELDLLAEQFNRLLERLSQAQLRNRRFLARVAHQLRTPLTVIRGESALALERPRTLAEHRDVLRRVSVGAEQMTHRVEDLFLLAAAEAGERPPLGDRIELDGLVLECTDLMRGRAHALGCQLDVARLDAAEVMGSEPLVREAVLELLENACRHGDRATAIGIATANGEGTARVMVSSGGTAIPAAQLERPADLSPSAPSGLGLSIVRWIALIHGGRLTYECDRGVNTFVLELKAAT